METMIDELERYRSSTSTDSDSTSNDGAPPATEAIRPITCLISQVNKNMRNVDDNEGDFIPQAVSIGPHHWLDGPYLEAKKAVLRRHVVQAGRHGNPGDELRQYVNAIKGIADQAIKHYFPMEKFNGIVNEDQFAFMLLLDGLFIVSLLRPVIGRGVTAQNQTLLSDIDIDMQRDVFYLLENQVPLFVLEKIEDLVGGASQRESNVVKCARDHLGKMMRDSNYSTATVSVDPLPCHLLHMLHMHFRPAALDPNYDGDGHDSINGPGGILEIRPRWRSAVYYRENGVRLKAQELGEGGAVRSILDVTLSGDKLLIPVLVIHDDTWTILRNLIALEQRNRELSSYVTAYCIFLSQLASTPKDVELLSDKGIIVHLLSNDEDVANGFRRLCKGIVFDINNTKVNYLKPTRKALEKICHSRRRRAIAWMRHSKCNNYAMTLVVMAGAIAFACTVVQTVLAVLSYKK